MMFVYVIKNIKINYCYLGSTINFKKRQSQHLSDLRGNRHCNYKLQRAFNKYGEEYFVFDILCLFSGNIRELEQDILNQFWGSDLTAYNILSEVNTPPDNTGKILGPCPPDRKKKIADSLRGQKRGPQSIEHIVKRTAHQKGKPKWNDKDHPCLGKKMSNETKQKISRANQGNKSWTGKKHSEETKRKISLSKRKNSKTQKVEDKPYDEVRVL